MGCDIHWTIEVKHTEKWVGVLNDSGLPCKAADRWYAFFTELAGVRGDSETAYDPRGLPHDISDLTKYFTENSAWDHTGSWLTIDEFVAAYNRAVLKYLKNPEEKELTKEELFGFAWWPLECKKDQVRIVFAFDN